MAYTTINKSTDYFNTKLYTGNGSTNAITGVGFQPDFTWLKRRSGTGSHLWQNAVRGAVYNIRSDNTDTEHDSGSIHLNSFDADGFTVAGTGTHSNDNGSTYASWNWKAGTTSGVDFSSGDITPTAYSINTTSGIGIYHYTCTGANATMVHGLSSAPKMLITKSLGDTAPWAVWHTGMNPTNYLVLDTTAAEVTGTAMWNSTAPSSSVISLGSDGQSNGSGKNNIMYAFSEVAGYSRFMSWTGSGDANGAYLFCGFKPSFFIYKVISGTTGGWGILDNKRDENLNPREDTLVADVNSAGFNDHKVDFLSNGLKVWSGGGNINYSGAKYIGMAFGQTMVGTNGVPATAE